MGGKAFPRTGSLRRVAFLRGINLGNRRVSNDALARAVTASGVEDVAVYQASGNVIFESDGASEFLEQKISETLNAELGYSVDCMLRDGRELHALVEGMPFGKDEIAAAKGQAQCILVREPLSDTQRGRVSAMSTEEDPLHLGERVVYWLPKHGVAKSALDWRGFESLVGRTTTRGLPTMERILARFFSS